MLKLECPNWHKTAPCAGNDKLFFSSNPTDRKNAKLICVNSCSNRDECLEYAVSNSITIGVWGGMTGPELARLQS